MDDDEDNDNDDDDNDDNDTDGQGQDLPMNVRDGQICFNVHVDTMLFMMPWGVPIYSVFFLNIISLSRCRRWWFVVGGGSSGSSGDGGGGEGDGGDQLVFDETLIDNNS